MIDLIGTIEIPLTIWILACFFAGWGIGELVT
jgi:hypothetical protein